jgi:hypothetical protein
VQFETLLLEVAELGARARAGGLRARHGRDLPPTHPPRGRGPGPGGAGAGGGAARGGAAHARAPPARRPRSGSGELVRSMADSLSSGPGARGRRGGALVSRRKNASGHTLSVTM